MITLDALRFDVAESAMKENETPHLQRLFPDGWERRHSPGNFTYAAHAALFAGFWPTPLPKVGLSDAGIRPFALSGVPSRTIGTRTCRLGGDTIVEGLRLLSYHTVCVGGVGFFDGRTPLGSVFPQMFDESHWEPTFAPTSATSARAQSQCAADCVREAAMDQPLFLFINFSATHPPTRLCAKGISSESVVTQQAALRSIDRHLLLVVDAFTTRERPVLVFCLSDHGTTFGEDGCQGHRIGHPNVWTVPYAETLLNPSFLKSSTRTVGVMHDND